MALYSGEKLTSEINQMYRTTNRDYSYFLPLNP